MRTALISLLSSIAVAVMVLAMPASALAASVPFYYGGIGGGEPLLPCTGFSQITLQESKPDPNDPKLSVTTYTDYQAVSGVATNGLRQCQSLCDVFLLINNLLRFVISVLITIFAPIMFLIGGFYIMTSGGNPDNRKTGIRIFTGTLIGIAISLCAALIIGQLMTLVFDEQWGDTLKQKLSDQATQAGVDSTKIPNFTWNTLTCTVTDGAVNIGTGDSTKNPYYVIPTPKTPDPTSKPPTREPNPPSTINPGSGAAAMAQCYTDAQKAALTCSTFWWTDTRCAAGGRNMCASPAASQTCYSAVNKGRVYCGAGRSWQQHPNCSKFANEPWACI